MIFGSNNLVYFEYLLCKIKELQSYMSIYNYYTNLFIVIKFLFQFNFFSGSAFILNGNTNP